MQPSRCKCSSAFGRDSMSCGRAAEATGLVRELRTAGVDPSCEPIGANIGGCIGKLLDQGSGGLVIEAVVVIVGVRVKAAAGAAVGEENGFELAVGVQADFEGVVGGVVDVGSVVGIKREEVSVAIDEHGVEAIIHAGLAGDFAVEIFGSVERVVGFSDVIGQKSGIQTGFLPAAGLEIFGELG